MAANCEPQGFWHTDPEKKGNDAKTTWKIHPYVSLTSNLESTRQKEQNHKTGQRINILRNRSMTVPYILPRFQGLRQGTEQPKWLCRNLIVSYLVTRYRRGSLLGQFRGSKSSNEEACEQGQRWSQNRFVYTSHWCNCVCAVDRHYSVGDLKHWTVHKEWFEHCIAKSSIVDRGAQVDFDATHVWKGIRLEITQSEKHIKSVVSSS